MEMSRLTRNGTAEPVSRDQILGREREQGKNTFPFSADDEQDDNLIRLILTLAICHDHTSVYTVYISLFFSLLPLQADFYQINVKLLQYVQLFPNPVFLLFVLQSIVGYKNEM